MPTIIEKLKILKVIKMDGCDGCTFWMYLVPLNCTLINGDDSQFCYIYFTTRKNFLNKKNNPLSPCYFSDYC